MPRPLFFPPKSARPVRALAMAASILLSLGLFCDKDDGVKPTNPGKTDPTEVIGPVVAMGADGSATVAYEQHSVGSDVYADNYSEIGTSLGSDRDGRLRQGLAGVGRQFRD